MKPVTIPLLLATGAVAAMISTKPPALTDKWETKQLSHFFWSEAAAAADVNGDGQTDVLSGPYWYEGPEFQKSHAIYPASQTFESKGKTLAGFEGALGTENSYSNNFFSFAHDISGDGKPDYLLNSFPGKETYWFENPSEKDGEWKRHTALGITDNESPMFVDIDGDRQPDLLCMSEGTLGYATYDPANPFAVWKWHAVSPVDVEVRFRFTHGLGHGDINGDGLTDLLEAKGWWQQPANWDGTSHWEFHPVNFGSGGAQMFGYDVNEDGRTDVITSLDAHGFGLAWFEQYKDGTFKRHLLTNTRTERGSTGVAFSQPHALDLADFNGDGTIDIVTGKRFWAHGSDGDPEPNEPAVLYVFLLTRENGKASYKAEIIHADSGVGCQVMATDLNKDGKADIIVGNKKGTFIHLQR